VFPAIWPPFAGSCKCNAPYWCRLATWKRSPAFAILFSACRPRIGRDGSDSAFPSRHPDLSRRGASRTKSTSPFITCATATCVIGSTGSSAWMRADGDDDVAINTGLYLFLDEMRGRKKNLSRILTQGIAKDGLHNCAYRKLLWGLSARGTCLPWTAWYELFVLLLPAARTVPDCHAVTLRWLFLTSLLVYLLTAGSNFTSGDAYAELRVTQSLVDHRWFDEAASAKCTARIGLPESRRRMADAMRRTASATRCCLVPAYLLAQGHDRRVQYPLLATPGPTAFPIHLVSWTTCLFSALALTLLCRLCIDLGLQPATIDPRITALRLRRPGLAVCTVRI